MNGVRQRFWIETVLGTASGLLCLLTLVQHDWIENAFGIDPDAGSGSLEWAIVFGALAVTIVFAALARQEWKRRQTVVA